MIFVIYLIDCTQNQYMPYQSKQTDHDKSFFKSILDTAIDGIIIIDTNGLIVLANESACNLFGYDEIDLIHQKINMLMPEHDKRVHDHYLLNHVGPHPKKIMGKGREINGLTKQGLTIPLRIAVSKFIIHEETFFTGVIHDLTEQKQIEEKLQVLNKSLENLVNSRTKQLQDSINQLSNANNILEIEIGQRKIVENKLKENEINLINALEKERDINQLKSRFVSIASHEFRTPLANILSSINLIDKYEDLETLEKRKKHIGKIKNNIHYLNGILNEFLNLTRIEEGRYEIKLEYFSLSELLQDIIDDFEFIKKNNQILNLNFDKLLKFNMNSDKTCIRHILNNLITNAIKYSSEGAIIDINLDEEKDHYIIDVVDHGIGIPEKEQKFIYDIFYRGSNVLNIQGTGLGLNIVKKYLEAIHGNLSFHSKENIGTSFHVKIPINAK
ncbi:MAG: PAS domain-containing sensor histidine kinase [Saprospiraceae bacterium]|uniref:Sensor protein FixL n=1 Tax=Candidatus Defluviibacterium haderslevense TaxID=2981993 RepID=A0A9D7SB03_9BACT|nr:PAS domain-containing sensor histidine kinase [Candidatus Defluviibacterium haderslevense]MBK9718493.1 PAS domain-containing sensor histidine kinase [Candidatus Defluviibacterium haderslevense]